MERNPRNTETYVLLLLLIKSRTKPIRYSGFRQLPSFRFGKTAGTRTQLKLDVARLSILLKVLPVLNIIN